MTDFLSYLLRIGGSPESVPLSPVLPLPAQGRLPGSPEEPEAPPSGSSENPAEIWPASDSEETAYASPDAPAPLLFGTLRKATNALLKSRREQVKNEAQARLLSEMRDSNQAEPSGIEMLIKTLERGTNLTLHARENPNNAFAHTPEEHLQSDVRTGNYPYAEAVDGTAAPYHSFAPGYGTSAGRAAGISAGQKAGPFPIQNEAAFAGLSAGTFSGQSAALSAAFPDIGKTPGPSAPADPEALSKYFERDARRY